MATDVTQVTVFQYQRPDLDHGKGTIFLGRTDILTGMIQVVREGGENNLHAHTATDGFWFVLGGRARFYGEDDVLLADLGRHEGILIPRGFKYWFESASDEPLEILRVGATVHGQKSERIDYTPPPSWVTRTPDGEVVYTSPQFGAARPQGMDTTPTQLAAE